MSSQLALECLQPTQTEHGSSRYSEYRRCPKAYQLRYTMGLRRTQATEDAVFGDKPNYFHVGQLIHACLDYATQTAMAGEDWGDWRRVLNAALDSDRYDELAVNEVGRLMQAYWARWGTDNAGWQKAKLIGSEVPCGAEVSNRHKVTTRLDQVIEIADQLIVVDTKTRSRRLPTDLGEYTRELATREQFLRHSALAQQHYELDEPPPVMINFIIKTKVPDFHRLLVPMSSKAVAVWWDQQAMAASEGFGLGSSMNFNACAPEIGSRCWAFDWCHGSQETRDRNFTKEGSST